MDLLTIAVGLFMLFFGRRLFWLFVGAAGFLAGIHMAVLLFPGEPYWILLLAALGAGLLGIVLSLVLYRVAFVLAGFFALLYLVLILTQSFPETVSLALSLAAGLAGALAAALLMDRAIIVVSSLAGAGAVTVGAGWDGPAALAGIAGLTLCGILFQSWRFGKRAPLRARPDATRTG